MTTGTGRDGDPPRPPDEDGRRKSSMPRWFPMLWVSIAVAAWTAYLATAEPHDAGRFSVIVRVMGSAGLLFLLFLVFKPRYGGVLALRRVRREEVEPTVDRTVDEVPESTSRLAVVVLTGTLALGAVLYHATHDSYLHQTSAFFIGVPAVLAITLSLTPRAKSATGMIVKGMTLALLLAGIVFAEGFICILMAAPLFYLVGILIGVPIDRARRRKRGETKIYSIVGVALLLMSVEGLTPATTAATHDRIQVTRTVAATTGQVTAALAGSPEWDDELPFYLRLGFPRPVAAYGRGLSIGDRRIIVFGNESPMEPMRSVRGAVDNALELEVVRSEPGLVAFRPVYDTTAFTHWIEWGRSVVRWEAVGGATRITWTLDYERKLSPAWYFGPWEHYAATLATRYLVDTVATP